MTTKCPVCDSENIEIKKDYRKLTVPFAESVLQEISVCHCKDCLSDILLDSEPKKIVQSRMLERAKESVPALLKKVNENGYSDSRLERALSLAPHTINRWKQGVQLSAAAIALSRFMSILPELTLAAEAGFNEAYARKAIVKKTLDKIAAVLNRNEQAILLINRRGFSTSVSCRKCGHIFKCPTCDIPLTYHKTDNMLKCHHCDFVMSMPEECPECGSKYIMKTGFGTERIEEEVHNLFPEAETLRLDSDSAKIRTKIPSIIEDFREKKANILIGTQMIAKGHDFPDVTLVGVVLADIGLSMPSFRSNERAFQLITQAVGRSGRKDKKGIAIIQTYIPNNYAITMSARQNYELFYRKEMEYRRIQSYPPYTFLASLTVAGKNEDHVAEAMVNIIDILNQEFGDDGQVLGPTVPYIPFEGNNYLRTALVKFKDAKLAKSILKKVVSIYASKSQVHLSINIDPYNF